MDQNDFWNFIQKARMQCKGDRELQTKILYHELKKLENKDLVSFQRCLDTYMAKILPDKYPDLGYMIDDIIAGKTEIKDLYPHFPSKANALEYYANIMTNRYSEKTKDKECQLCKHHPAVDTHSFHWHATVSNKIGWNILKSIFLLPFALIIIFIPFLRIPNIQADTIGINLFTTFHICPDCHKNLKYRRFIASFIGFWFGLALFISFCGTLFLGIMELSILLDWLKPFPNDEMPGLHNAFFISVLALMFAKLFIHPVQNYFLLPESIHRLVKKPFKLISRIGFQ